MMLSYQYDHSLAQSCPKGQHEAQDEGSEQAYQRGQEDAGALGIGTCQRRRGGAYSHVAHDRQAPRILEVHAERKGRYHVTQRKNLVDQKRTVTRSGPRNDVRLETRPRPPTAAPSFQLQDLRKARWRARPTLQRLDTQQIELHTSVPTLGYLST